MGYGFVANEVAGSEIYVSTCYCLLSVKRQENTGPCLRPDNLGHSKVLKLNDDDS